MISIVLEYTVQEVSYSSTKCDIIPIGNNESGKSLIQFMIIHPDRSHFTGALFSFNLLDPLHLEMLVMNQGIQFMLSQQEVIMQKLLKRIVLSDIALTAFAPTASLHPSAPPSPDQSQPIKPTAVSSITSSSCSIFLTDLPTKEAIQQRQGFAIEFH